jgi:hypothetical protein
VASALTLSGLGIGVMPVASAANAGVTGSTRLIASGGTAVLRVGATGPDTGIQNPEFAPEPRSDATGGRAPAHQSVVNRSESRGSHGDGQSNNGDGRDATNPRLNLSFDGLNFRQQRLANGGNQFSVEPPDQGMCAGNGFVVETVNDVFRVFHAADGSAATGVVDLNTFYGYPAAINRTTGDIGPFVTDPSCLFDRGTQRFYNAVLTLDQTLAGDLTGANHIDLAVSNSADPTGGWTIYRLPVQDDGSQGTPNHGCTDGAGNPGPCIGDYPHIGADRNGFYITTNEYEFFGNAFMGAQVYAFSKAQLAASASSVAVTQIDTAHAAPGDLPGFTLWPAQTSGNDFNDNAGGTESFLSSTAADEAQCTSGVVCSGTGRSNVILDWNLTGTSTLNTVSPALSLANIPVRVSRYAIPPKSNQKAGDFPLGQCINDTTMATPFGPGCWQFLFNPPEPAHTEVISHPDSNDTRMQQVTYADGKLWGALDTDVVVRGVHRAGIAWFIIRPRSGDLVNQGTLALRGNNVTYPAIGVTSQGRGVMAFTVMGDDHYPSAGYAGIDASNGTGAIHIAAEGRGPADGFTSYKAFVGDPPRTRWGDYGAAAVDGNSIWIASEYIAQTCTLAQYTTPPLGSCGGTRTALGNWATRISKVTP